MDNLNIERLKDLLNQNQNIAIVIGENHNLDDMGGALSLYLSLKKYGKNVSIACPKDPLVEISSLVGVDKVKKNLEGGQSGDLTVSFPYKENTNELGEVESEIQKVSYTLENGLLNIIVKPGPNGFSFTEEDVVYKRSGGTPALLFIVGTPTLSDLGSLFNPEALKETTIVNIDNKKNNQGFGEILLVSSTFSSVSELMADLLNMLGLEINVDIAQNLLSGISYATNNFQDPKTSTLAFEMAADLMKKGAVRKAVREEKSFNSDDFFLPSEPKSLPQIEEEPYPNYQRNNLQQNFKRHNQPFKRPSPSFQSRVQNQPNQQNQSSRSRPQFQPQSQPQTQSQAPFKKPNENKNNDDTPSDWLSPKIYKGSTSIE